MGLDEEKPPTMMSSRGGSEGNFATVAKQISQQKGTEAEPKQQQKMAVAPSTRKLAEKAKPATDQQQNNWQDW